MEAHRVTSHQGRLRQGSVPFDHSTLSPLLCSVGRIAQHGTGVNKPIIDWIAAQRDERAERKGGNGKESKGGVGRCFLLGYHFGRLGVVSAYQHAVSQAQMLVNVSNADLSGREPRLTSAAALRLRRHRDDDDTGYHRSVSMCSRCRSTARCILFPVRFAMTPSCF